MTPGIVHVLVVGAAVFACGGFLAARRPARTLGGIALMLGGAGIDLAGLGRFASLSSQNAGMGQELALLAAGIALAIVALGSALARMEPPR